MGESLMERHRVQDEGLRVVNCFCLGISAVPRCVRCGMNKFPIINDQLITRIPITKKKTIWKLENRILLGVAILDLGFPRRI